MSSNLVKEEEIQKILDESKILVQTVFDKCTVVALQLPSGFVIVESSGAVDKETYSEKIGAEICYSKIVERLWEFEGYLLTDKISKGEKYEENS